MNDPNKSHSLRAGSTTYLFDIKATKDSKPYLVITESRFKGESNQRQRASIIVFPEQAREFGTLLDKVIGDLVAKQA